MSNKRVSELTEILWNQVNPLEDLFLLSDISEQESKKIKVIQAALLFASFLTGSNGNGSSSYALSSSWSPDTITASYAIHALSASYCNCPPGLTASISGPVNLAYTASYLLYQGFPNGTASYALSASTSTLARTASNVSYTIGIDNGTIYRAVSASYVAIAATASSLAYTGLINGTASNAITASYSLISQNSRTSSFLVYTGVNNGTASNAVTASNAITASYLKYSPTNGTASNAITSSYALVAQRIANQYNELTPLILLPGGYLETYLGIGYNTASFSSVDIPSQRDTIISAIFDAVVQISPSFDSGAFSFVIQNIDPLTPWTLELDKTFATTYSTSSVGINGGYERRRIYMSGYVSLDSGSYLIYITSSQPTLIFEPTTYAKFFIKTKHDVVNYSL